MTETKFRADHVGSLLRPESLLNARRQHAAGKIGDEELRAAENAAIGHAVALQVEAGIDVVTDGEFRRRDFRTGFVDAVDGFTMQTWEMPWHSGEGVTKLPSHPTVPVKVTLIAPGFLEDRFWKDGVTDQFYASREEFAAEVAAITRAEISALIADGVRNIQIDNPGYGRRHHRVPRLPRQPVVDVDGRGRLRADRRGDVRVPAGRPVPARVRRRAGRRVRDAALRPAKYIDLGNLALSPQCGFASIAEGGNRLTEAEQYAKLALVAQVARATWD
jgi:methionine synthase II (cobalamin-independent)